MPELLPRFKADAQRVEDEKKIAAIIVESEEVEDIAGMPLCRSADGHGNARARGVPIVGRVCGGGAIPGTDPVAALLRKDSSSSREPGW